MSRHRAKGITVGIVTTSSETAFNHAPEKIYDFVTNPANWTKTYPGSAHVGALPDRLPLEVGDTWTESGPDGDRILTWNLAIAMRPKLWVFNSVGGAGVTLFTRSMTIEADKHAPLPDALFKQTNPANIDSYHAAIARELG